MLARTRHAGIALLPAVARLRHTPACVCVCVCESNAEVL